MDSDSLALKVRRYLWKMPLRSKSRFRYGCSRMVFLIGNYAIKLPNFRYRYPAFLWGLIHNNQEKTWFKCPSSRDAESLHSSWREDVLPMLCPILWSDPWGICLVMKRASPLGKEYSCPIVYQWMALRFAKAGVVCPAEPKEDSYGFVDGKIVAVDYA